MIIDDENINKLVAMNLESPYKLSKTNEKDIMELLENIDSELYKAQIYPEEVHLLVNQQHMLYKELGKRQFYKYLESKE